jgi:tRNA threonylcarbamoyladenosine biosynthesis protein TsaE
MIIHTAGPEATAELGREIGSVCTGGEIIGLVGALGAGKTCLVHGLAAGLDIDRARVRSPSFTLVNEHQGRLRLFHIDLYRLDTVAADELWLREYLYGGGVAVVEWIDRVRGFALEEHLRIMFAIAGPTDRQLVLTARGDCHAGVLAKLAARRGSHGRDAR